jgi:predicted DsbA family dithiol-disulfide isomerase
MEERRYLPAIQQDYNDARGYGITGTPAFFVNGRPIVGAQPFDEFARVILEELETAGVDIEQFDLPSLLPEISTPS